MTRHYKRSSSGWPTEDLPAGQPPTFDLDQRSLRPLTGESRVELKPKTVVVSLPIVDLDRSLRFYRDGLGLSPTGLDEAILAFEPRDWRLRSGVLAERNPGPDHGKRRAVTAP
nr:hypothetical protein GCM10017611_42430 [Rhodococcus wratislaviensis]